MPINLPVPEPEAQAEATPATEPPKRKRRSKEEMIAAARIPADDEQVDLKDGPTGAKIQRPWLVALEMVREGKATFVDNEMKHAMTKYDRQKAAPGDEIDNEMAAPGDVMEAAGEAQPTFDRPNVPPEAEVGDEIVIGADTFRLGHGGALVDDFKNLTDEHGKTIPAARRWQRELGAGADGPWESVKLQSAPAEPESNGKGIEAKVETERLPLEIDHVGGAEWRVGTGILDKIGLPSRGGEWSSLQVGPLTASRTVIDDGRRTMITLKGVERAVPTASIEAFHEASALVEYMANFMRGELTTFLESQGVTLSPLVPA